MKKVNNNLIKLILVGVVTAAFAWIVSGIIFKSPVHSAQAPSAPTITSTFPDVKNNPAYNSFLNGNALDPTQTITIGNSSNSTPFSGSQ